MRTDEKILEAALEYRHCDNIIVPDTYVHQAVLAAMKEAREEYAIAFHNFVTWKGYKYSWANRCFYHYSQDRVFWHKRITVTEDEMHEMFNTHQAAIKAEKERGKG